MQRGHYSTQTIRGPGPGGALFDTTMFQYKQSRKKVKSLWEGGGGWKSGLCCLGAQPQPAGGGVGPDCQHGRARWHQG